VLALALAQGKAFAAEVVAQKSPFFFYTVWPKFV
jgi:hypothetical protein